jgi:hypothetical protein
VGKNKKMRALMVAVFALALNSCAQKYALDSFQPPPQHIARNSSVYVILPENGRYGNRTYLNSGRETAQALFTSLSAVTNKIEISSTTESVDAALSVARPDGAAYVFQPMILNWVDHATEWSGIPDRITIKLIVYDAQDGKEVASIMARSSSKWATFGGDHPQDLLPRVMKEFTRQLF